MRLGLGNSLSNQLIFGGGAAPPPTYSPAELFQSGEAGIWYDYQDFSSMWQDSAGTVPAAVNQPVGRVDDKSGNGNHKIQATAAARPILRDDGTGHYYLEHDGVDDRMVAPYSGNNVYERVSAIRQITWTLNDQFFSGGSGAGELRQAPSTPSFQIVEVGRGLAPNSDLPIGANGVVTERYTGVDTFLQVNQGTEASVIGGTASPAPTQLSVGGRSNGTLCANMRLYGLVQRAGAMTTQQRSDLQEYLAGISGVNFP